jgi:8-amino-7-oxononanoate synthase
MPAPSISRRLRERLAAIDAEGLRRSLRAPSGIDLSSNDYLGLAKHPLLKQRMAEAVMAEGVGSTGSRLLRGERAGFTRVEQNFARFKGTARSLYFSSGYLANLAVLTTFPESGDVIFSDERNHASLIDGVRLSRARRVIFPHSDVTTLAKLLREATGAAQKFVVVESLFSMDGDEAPLAEYAALCRETGAALIVDEAHAVGIYGATGSGLVAAQGIAARGIAEDVLVSVNPAGKAMGVSGAFVAGSSDAVEALIQEARPFIFSTAPPPAVAAALEASLEVIAAEPERRSRLLGLSRYLRERLRMHGCSHIIPVMIGDNQRAVAVARELQAAGFDVRAIRPPTVPPGTARLRVSLNCGLMEETLDRFAVALEEATKLEGAAKK